MSNIICIDTREFPLSETEVRGRHPDMLIPEPFCCPDGYALVDLGEVPAHDATTHKAVPMPPEQDEAGEWHQPWDVVPLTAEEIEAATQVLREQLYAAATAHRWAVETGGIAFPDGTRIATGLEDQNRITSVIANAQIAGVAAVDFKAASGWVSLTLAELQGIAASIALHVQACFAAERVHHEAIAAAGLAALRAYDVTQGWPA